MPMPTLELAKEREDAYRAALRKWLQENDARFRDAEARASHVTPLRRPRGDEFERHTRRYFWTDALWCQDRGFDVFQELFEVTDQEISDLFEYGGDLNTLREWGQTVFEEEFRAAFPDLADVLEG